MDRDAERAAPCLRLALQFPTSSFASSAWAGRASARVPAAYTHSLVVDSGAVCHPSSLPGQQVHQDEIPALQDFTFLVVIILLLISLANDALDQLFKTAVASLTTIVNLLATSLVLFLVFAIALTQLFRFTQSDLTSSVPQ